MSFIVSNTYDIHATASLDLQFANKKSLVDQISGQNLVDFTRASSGTYVDSEGVIRSAVTNLLLQSEDFSTTWNNSGSSETTDAIAAPNGTVTADKLIESAGGTTHFINQTVTIVSSTVYTLSVFAKAAERSRVALYFGGGGGAAQGIIVNLTNGTFAANIVAAPTSYSIIPFGDGWYRISITATSAGTAGNHSVYICDNTNAFSYSGDGTSGIYLWGAQLEQSTTVGEYVPTTSTINSAPRFDHDPTTGESLGLLVEESRTNLLLQSEDFSTTWTGTGLKAFGSGSVVNDTVAPDGKTTADFICEDTSTGFHRIGQTFSYDANVVRMFSVYAKANGRTKIHIQLSSGLFKISLFDLTGAGSATGDGVITAVGNGWYRCSLFSSEASAGNAIAYVEITANDGSRQYTGDGTSGIYLWGAQLEAGAFPTSYIPTTDSTVTRAADVASISGSNFSSWYRQDEGTVFADFIDGNNTNSKYPYAISDNTINNRFTALRSGSSSLLYRVVSAGVQENPSSQTVNLGAPIKNALAARVGTNEGNAATNGALTTPSSPAAMPVVDRMFIGSNHAGLEQLGSTLRRLTYWPQRLPNSTLQTITQ